MCSRGKCLTLHKLVREQIERMWTSNYFINPCDLFLQYAMWEREIKCLWQIVSMCWSCFLLSSPSRSPLCVAIHHFLSGIGLTFANSRSCEKLDGWKWKCMVGTGHGGYVLVISVWPRWNNSRAAEDSGFQINKSDYSPLQKETASSDIILFSHFKLLFILENIMGL